MHATTRTVSVFSGVDPPESWPRTRSVPRPDRLQLPLDVLAGVGATMRKRLAKLGLETIRDLLRYRPFRYEAAAPQLAIADVFGEDEVAIAGVVRSVRKRRARRVTIVTARIEDESGEIDAVWFNQDWLAERLKPGTHVRLRGQQRRDDFIVKSYDLGEASATADFAPVYPASEQVPPKRLRALAEAALEYADDVPELLPAELRERERLPLVRDAVVAVHRPRVEEEAERGRRRLAFDELLELQVALALARREREGAQATALGEPAELIARYRAGLPFKFTEHQERAIADLDHDLARTAPMQRLLQGDVGSGKTVVALYALLRAVEQGFQGALMAPTETLAEQHFLTIEPICTELGVRVALLTGSIKGEIDSDIVVGTHALIQEGVDFPRLAVAVVDEQHRFGVAQRQAISQGHLTAGQDGTRAKPASLLGGTASGAAGVAQRQAISQGHLTAGQDGTRAKPASLLGGTAGGTASGAAEVEQRRALVEGRTPHVLHMTATPIPRTLALTLYGDLAVSEIAKPPANRKPIVTRWVPQEKSSEAYRRLRRLLEEGRQAYVVCPVIEESETRRARAAEAEAERLRRAELRGFRVGCLHGRLPPGKRREVMAQFKAGDLDVLVATTVIEVGVDVSNATVMIIQEGDRFGLAQLHQLRGRVGRGAEQSYCLLVSRAKEELTDSARARLEAMVETTDGFELAERDLEIRGEGELLGTRQSGPFGLRFASLRGDRDLLELARREADKLAGESGLLQEEVARRTAMAAAA